MLPIQSTSPRVTSRLLVLTAILLWAGFAGSVRAEGLPVNGVEDFQRVLSRDLPDFSSRTEEPDKPDQPVEPDFFGEQVGRYYQFHQDLVAAEKRLATLGDVARVLLLVVEWDAPVFSFTDEVVTPQDVRDALARMDEEPFQETLQKLRQTPKDQSSTGAILLDELKKETFKESVQELVRLAKDKTTIPKMFRYEIKQEVRDRLMKRLDERLRFYLRSDEAADRIASANLVEAIMSSTRKQANAEGAGSSEKALREARMTADQSLRFLRQQMSLLRGELQRLTRDPDVQARIAAVRALSNLEGRTADTVAVLKPLLDPARNEAALRRATAMALAHLTELVYLQMDKSRPLPTLKNLEQIFPIAAIGLADADTEVRRDSLLACQRVATALDDLTRERRVSTTGSLGVFRPMAEVLRQHLPSVNRVARDTSGPVELRVAACHVLETLVRPLRSLRPRESAPPSSPPAKRDSGASAPGVTLAPPIGLRDDEPAPSDEGVRQVAFAAPPEELPGPTPLAGSLQDTIDTMKSRLRDRDYRVRLAAVDVLETLGDRAESAIPEMVTSLADPSKFVRWSAARTLGRLAPRQAKIVVPGLMRMLDDREDMGVRVTAAKALEQYGGAAKEAVPTLARVINRGDNEYILAILHTIQGIGPEAEAALPSVAWILRNDKLPTSVRVEAARTLGIFGSLAKKQLPALRAMMTNPEEEIRAASSNAVLAVNRPK